MLRTDERSHCGTLREMLESSYEMFREYPAFEEKKDDGYVAYTYQKLYNDAKRLGSALRAKGLTQKNIAVIGKNSVIWNVSYFATVCFCGTAVPVSPSLSETELAEVISACDISAILYDDDCDALIASVPASVEKISFEKAGKMIYSGKRTEDYIPEPESVAELACTSGTTGTAKAVVLSHRSICASIHEIRHMIPADTDTRLYSVLPLTHIYERVCGMIYPVYSGACVAYGEGLRHLTTNLRAVHPTVMLCVPLIIETLYRKIWQNIERKGIGEKVRRAIRLTESAGPLRTTMRRRLFVEIHDTLGGNLSVLICGGASAQTETVMGLREFGIRVFTGYGLTESCSFISVNNKERHEYSSVGMQSPGGLVDIYNIQSDGIGEIRYKGSNLMTGYYKDDALTEKVIRGGWLYTGDMGYFDRRGFLHLTGRLNNVITTGKGHQVFPEELEELLCKNPFVSEAVVVGVVSPDRNEREIIAHIYPDYTNLKELYGSSPTTQQIRHELENAIETVNAQTESYKTIRKYYIRKRKFNRNDEGKIIRSDIKGKAESNE